MEALQEASQATVKTYHKIRITKQLLYINNNSYMSEVHNLFGPRVAVYIFSALEGRRQIWIINLGSQVSKSENKVYLTSLFVVCALILLPSELFHIVISYKIVNSSMRFKFFYIKSPSFMKRFLYFLTSCEGWI